MKEYKVNISAKVKAKSKQDAKKAMLDMMYTGQADWEVKKLR